MKRVCFSTFVADPGKSYSTIENTSPFCDRRNYLPRFGFTQPCPRSPCRRLQIHRQAFPNGHFGTPCQKWPEYFDGLFPEHLDDEFSGMDGVLGCLGILNERPMPRTDLLADTVPIRRPTGRLCRPALHRHQSQGGRFAVAGRRVLVRNPRGFPRRTPFATSW